MNYAKHSHVQRIVALLAMAAIFCQQASADIIQWNVPAGSWFNPNNWVPSVIPASDDEIYIGNLPGVQNGVVWLGGALTAGFDHLEVTSGMTLDLNGTELVSFGHAWITGLNTRLIVRPAPLGINPHDFQAILHLGVLAELQLEEGVEIRIFFGSESSGRISGRGHILVASDNSFINNGIIDPANNGGITMTYGQPFGDQPADLDGTTGNGQLVLDDAFSTLAITAGSLTDSFSGTIIMAAGTVLTMNVIDGWTADSNSQINIEGSNSLAFPSFIDGEEFTFGGSMSVANREGHVRVLAPTILNETAEIAINNTGWVEWNGETTVNGGVYTLNQDAYMDFNGPTEMKGGVFNTFSNLLQDGFVNFNGATTWNGNVTINGVARQNGDAEVTDWTVIDAGVFDMDGGDGVAAWDIKASFVINADGIDSTIGNRFNGTIDVGGGFLGKLVVNLSDSDANWGMDGTMNLSGVTDLFMTRLAGSPVDVEGVVNIDGNVIITANVTFSGAPGGATLNLGTDGAVLAMTGETVVEEGVQILGDATLQNGSTGMMILDDGVSLGNVALVNLGLLKLAEGPGSVSMEYFENSSSGTWVVELGGYLPGSEHDQLIISGAGALLDGQLEIELLDVGGEQFMPQIGDEFTILTMPNGIDGAFANAPVTTVGSKVYEWSVQYLRSNVLVRLDNVTTECNVPNPIIPAPYALLGIGPDSYAPRNRYLSFVPPELPIDASAMALRVTFTKMPGPGDCPLVDDYSAFDNQVMWVGAEVSPIGVGASGSFELQPDPLFQDWSSVVQSYCMGATGTEIGETVPCDSPAVETTCTNSGGICQPLIILSDCNIVPCAEYTIEVVTDNCPLEESSFSDPVALPTADIGTACPGMIPRWADVVGQFDPATNRYEPADGCVDFNDIAALVERFKNVSKAPPRSWCDLVGGPFPISSETMSQAATFNIDFIDIGTIVKAFSGEAYPLGGPTAPSICP